LPLKGLIGLLFGDKRDHISRVQEKKQDTSFCNTREKLEAYLTQVDGICVRAGCEKEESSTNTIYRKEGEIVACVKKSTVNHQLSRMELILIYSGRKVDVESRVEYEHREARWSIVHALISAIAGSYIAHEEVVDELPYPNGHTPSVTYTFNVSKSSLQQP
jgi:hypothetical protein